MNRTISMGNLTDDPKIRRTATGKKVAEFTLALNRGKDGADYPRFIAWEQKADLIEKHCHKGMKLLVEGRIQTGSYEKDGKKVYTTDIVADSIEFCERKPREDDGSDAFMPQDIDDMEMPFA